MKDVLDNSGRLRGSRYLGVVLTFGLVTACTSDADSGTGMRGSTSSSKAINTSSISEQDTATVDEILSGDSIAVLRDGEIEQIQLINVAAPEPDSAREDSGCLGEEAQNFVSTLIPVGSTVALEFDSNVADGQGRILAAVRTADGELVNSAITSHGLGIAVSFGSSTQFLPEIRAGQEAARAAQAGLYSRIDCTLLAALESIDCGLAFTATATGQTTGTAATPTTELEAPTATGSLTVLQASRAAQTADTAFNHAKSVHQRFLGPHLGVMWAAFTADEIAEFADHAARSVSACSNKLDQAMSEFEVVSKAATKAAKEERARKAAAEKVRAQELAAAKAAELAEEQRAAQQRQLAHQQAEQERAAAEAEQRRLEAQAAADAAQAQADQTAQEEAQRAAAEAAAQQEESNNSNSGGSGYTGPRCYAPGGKTWSAC